jgi:hypothetical protein
VLGQYGLQLFDNELQVADDCSTRAKSCAFLLA